LLAGIIEVGSALGFTLISMATARNPQPPSTTRHVAGSSNSAGPQAHARRSTGSQARERRVQTRHAAGSSKKRASCASCPLAGPRYKPPLPAPGSVPSLQVRSHTKPQLSPRADPLDLPGSFAAPHGLALDSKNDLYVSEVTWTFAVSRGRAPEDCHSFQKFALVV
jgi:hypothetical protein